MQWVSLDVDLGFLFVSFVSPRLLAHSVWLWLAVVRNCQVSQNENAFVRVKS